MGLSCPLCRLPLLWTHLLQLRENNPRNLWFNSCNSHNHIQQVWLPWTTALPNRLQAQSRMEAIQSLSTIGFKAKPLPLPIIKRWFNSSSSSSYKMLESSSLTSREVSARTLPVPFNSNSKRMLRRSQLSSNSCSISMSRLRNRDLELNLLKDLLREWVTCMVAVTCKHSALTQMSPSLIAVPQQPPITKGPLQDRKRWLWSSSS